MLRLKLVIHNTHVKNTFVRDETIEYLQYIYNKFTIFILPLKSIARNVILTSYSTIWSLKKIDLKIGGRFRFTFFTYF